MWFDSFHSDVFLVSFIKISHQTLSKGPLIDQSPLAGRHCVSAVIADTVTSRRGLHSARLYASILSHLASSRRFHVRASLAELHWRDRMHDWWVTSFIHTGLASVLRPVIRNIHIPGFSVNFCSNFPVSKEWKTLLAPFAIEPLTAWRPQRFFPTPN